LLDNHLRTERPVAAHVDYRGGTSGDHWILVVQKNGDHTYTAIDPATGGAMTLMSGRDQSVNHARYAQTWDKRTGILFGMPGGRPSQQRYIVVRFGLLA
jgi:Ethanolamine utilization protein EutJ (predicted chaperonin)